MAPWNGPNNSERLKISRLTKVLWVVQVVQTSKRRSIMVNSHRRTRRDATVWLRRVDTVVRVATTQDD